MTDLLNSIQNNGLSKVLSHASQNVASAIKQASLRTGVDFAYLVRQAKVESSFNPEAKAKTSSATGLYQFIESTWLSMVERHGAKHGIETDGLSRKDILALRNDPQKASFMAAELASENERFLKTHYNGSIGPNELYLAHFLGAGQAAAFLNARAENPMQEAALIFPKAAKANKTIFYDNTTGKARSLEEIYGFFNRKLNPDEPKLKEEMPKIAGDAPQTEKPVVKRPVPGRSYGDLVMNSLEILILTQMDDPLLNPSENRKNHFNQLFSYQSYLR